MSTPVQFVYSSLPKLNCKRKCQGSCGPIEAGAAEILAFEKTTGKQFPNALQVLRSYAATCPLLDAAGACSVHQHRPLICRLWGMVKRMRCPFGCEPERWVGDDEAWELIRLMER